MLTFEKLCMGCMNDNGGEAVCPICGHTAGTPNPSGPLPIKTRIQGKYYIGKAIEKSGEGITYIGWDDQAHSIINIREFFPVPLAKRNEDLSVSVTEGNDFSFNAALMDFLALAKKLKGITLAAVPQIYDIIECNNTAYIISKAVPGITLREFLLRNGGTLSWEQAKALFMPLISSVSALHKEGIIHGGISPETVMVGRDGKLRLSGFAIAQLRKSSSPINSQVFPGYAAAEQYGLDDGEMDEATDVYGFAATLFRVLMGSTLPEANERITDDKMTIPAKIAEALPKPVLTTLANALQILKENRTKNMDELKIDISPAIDMTTSFNAVGNKPEPVKESKPINVNRPHKKDNSAKKAAVLSAVITAAALLVVFFIFWLLMGGLSGNGTSTPASSSSVPDNSSSIVDSSSTPSQSDELLLEVPDFTKDSLTFEEVCNRYPEFKFKILGKKYSSKAAGIVVDQDYKAGSKVKRDATVYVTLSLGPEVVIMPNLYGMSEQEALIELFKNGFNYKNVTFYEIEDATVDYHHVVKTDPAVGDSLSIDDKILIYYSSVKPAPPEDNTSSDTSSTPVTNQ